jgi:hypothetical protein
VSETDQVDLVLNEIESLLKISWRLNLAIFSRFKNGITGTCLISVRLYQSDASEL